MNHVRLILLIFTIAAVLAADCHAQAINSKAVAYLGGKIGQKIGGGECAHVASEALRVGGGEFINSVIGADSPVTGDYVWGSLMKAISYNGKWVDSNPSTKLIPGDVLQYRNTTFVTTTAGGTSTSTASQHTSVVAVVNSAGMPTYVYEQNLNGVRTLAKKSIDLTKLQAGYVRCYRPKARADKAGTFKFSLVNNSNAATNASIIQTTNSKAVGTFNLTKINTASSYKTSWCSSSNMKETFSILLPNKKTVRIANGGAYQVIADSKGQLVVLALIP